MGMDILPQERLAAVWDAARAGMVTWESVRQHQADLMPRCVNHTDRPAPVIWEGQALCVGCIEAGARARREEACHATEA